MKGFTTLMKTLTMPVKPFTTPVKPRTTLVKPCTTPVKPCTTLVKPFTTPVKPCTTLVKPSENPRHAQPDRAARTASTNFGPSVTITVASPTTSTAVAAIIPATHAAPHPPVGISPPR